ALVPKGARSGKREGEITAFELTAEGDFGEGLWSAPFAPCRIEDEEKGTGNPTRGCNIFRAARANNKASSIASLIVTTVLSAG
ncbi:hypothetical protein THAOC_26979, partial [Thalassiosira oceanica]